MDNVKMDESRCPYCGAGIPIQDVNVATDLALCRKCGNTTPFSAVTGAAQIPTAVPVEPPRWVKVHEGFGGEKTIVFRRPSLMLLFFVPFTLFWSGLSMLGIYIYPLSKGTLDWEMGLFGLPFLIGTVALLTLIAYLAFGKCTVTLQGGNGTVFVGVGSLGWTRKFTYGEDTVVLMRLTTVSVNDVRQTGIVVKTGDEELVFGTILTDDAKTFIGSMIRLVSRGGSWHSRSGFAGWNTEPERDYSSRPKL